MANFGERLRTAADDFLRVVGIWALAGTTLTTFAVATAVATAGYVRGVRTTWLVLVGGIAIGFLINFIVVVALWLIHRRRLRAELFIETDAPRGYLDDKRASNRGMKQLAALQPGLGRVVASIGGTMSQSTAVLNYFSPRLSESGNDAFGTWLSNLTAWRLRRKSAKYAALITEYEATTDRVIKVQVDFFAWLLTTDKPKEEWSSLRDSIAFLVEQLNANIKVGKQWSAVLSGHQPTGRMIVAARGLVVLINRFVAANEKASTHSKGLVDQINRKINVRKPRGR